MEWVDRDVFFELLSSGVRKSFKFVVIVALYSRTSGFGLPCTSATCNIWPHFLGTGKFL
jgi:hypothetical protein